MSQLTAAEFFAGIGLMRMGLEEAGIETLWANDLEPDKCEMYVANFGDDEFVLGDIRDVRGSELPGVDVATASFPCTDLSLAGNRSGLGAAAAPRGTDGGSSMFWEFSRVLREMGDRRPSAVLLENVLGFASSHQGRDLREAIHELNSLGYSCDLLAVDARHFVAQSRPRMFIVGLDSVDSDSHDGLEGRPEWIRRFAADNQEAELHFRRLPEFPNGPTSLHGVVERFAEDDEIWWSESRTATFLDSLSPIQAERVAMLRRGASTTWRTAYRRTRNGSAVWEIRADGIAGCLRTARGGSSKQALVEVRKGALRVRWMTPREYARLMGAPEYKLSVRRNQSLFGFGDAVCVPAVAWICENYLEPALAGETAVALAA